MEYAWYLLAAFPAAIGLGVLYWIVQDIRKEREIRKMQDEAERHFRGPSWDLNDEGPE